MLSLIAQPATDLRPLAYAEAVSRLASVRHALRLVDGGFSVGPGGDMAHDDAIAVAWDECGEAKQRRFDRSSERLVSATAAGVEALLIERRGHREPHAAASEALVEEIRRELRDIAGLILA